MIFTFQINVLKPKVLNLLRYFESFENESGLLENLESWIFIEWSKANSFVQDVNYPTNMLYATALETVSELYDLNQFKEEAGKIRDTIRQQAFNGQFFVDNAIRDEKGELKVTSNTSEVCQYYAFFFNLATPDSHPNLWQKLVAQFGPGRRENNPSPAVHFANSFIGNYLRLELLSRYHLTSQIMTESVDYFDYMAQRTGTLWENQSAHASCNHGFASHIVHLLYRDILGICNIDYPEKVVTIRFSDLNLASCSGVIPLEEGLFSLAWEKDENRILYQLKIPANYQVKIENNTGLFLERTN